VTMQQIDNTVHKLKPRLFHKFALLSTEFTHSAHLQANSTNFIFWYELYLTAIREVLLIEYEDRWWRLVTYLSKSFNETEKNHKIHNKEMLVVIRRLENRRHLLEDAKFKFEVWIDYIYLETYNGNGKSRYIKRWEYKMIIKTKN